MPSSDAPVNVRLELHPVEPRVLGIGEDRPRLSWVVPAADEGWEQTAYEVELVRDAAATSHVVESGDQVLVPWPGEPLASRERRRPPRSGPRRRDWSDWSEASERRGRAPARGRTGRPASSARRRSAAWTPPAPLLAGTWELPDDVASARLYVTAHGVYEASSTASGSATSCSRPAGRATRTGCATRPTTSRDLLRPGANDVERAAGQRLVPRPSRPGT